MDAKSVFSRIWTDVLIWAISGLLCILWRVAADKAAILVYVWLFAAMMGLWLLLGLITGKYHRSYKTMWLWQEMLGMLVPALVEFAIVFWPARPVLALFNLSVVVAIWMIGIVAAFCALVIVGKHYWKYAQNMDVPPMEIEKRSKAKVLRRNEPRSEQSVEAIHQSVLSITTEEDYQMLLDKAHLDSRQTKIVANRDRFSFLQIPDYQYKTIVDLTLLNDAKGINRRFCIVNQKLPDDGIYVCCYRPQEYMKQKLLNKYPKPLNWIVYTLYFWQKRVVPRLALSSRLYYDLTKGRKRMLSKTEVFGRLYYCGFVVDEVVPMGHIEYVFAHRKMQPYPQEQVKIYGPLIKLPRICKNGEIRFFYKFRTMHPYAEYIQDVVFDQQGGMNIADKADGDWRISSWGRVMRKYWLDELPMLINWFKGDVKLVGVRPLSQAMFNKYPKELQEKRIKARPGLIPPFYIDHPNTFDELFASEDKYLDAYLKHPIRTDFVYFFRTVHSILFTKMHSA